MQKMEKSTKSKNLLRMIKAPSLTFRRLAGQLSMYDILDMKSYKLYNTDLN